MNPKVVIVDDDDVNNFLCKRIITLANFSTEVKSFETADSALQFLQANASNKDMLPDILFLDINMPVKNGWDFLNEFETFKNELAKEIKIYMLSSSVYEQDVERATSIADVVDYISKPLDASILAKIQY